MSEIESASKKQKIPGDASPDFNLSNILEKNNCQHDVIYLNVQSKPKNWDIF